MLLYSDALKRIFILVTAINVITPYEEEFFSYHNLFFYN